VEVPELSGKMLYIQNDVVYIYVYSNGKEKQAHRDL
jgi:hypothetical protein